MKKHLLGLMVLAAQSAMALSSDEIRPGEVRTLDAGTYFLQQPLVLTQKHSGTAEKPTVIRAVPGTQVILSGGIPIPGAWTERDGGIRSTILPEVKKGEWFFRQVFSEDRILPRARIPDEGWLFGLKGSQVTNDVNRNVARSTAEDWRKDRLDLFTTLRVQEQDLGLMAAWPDIHSGELLNIGSWDTSWHSMRSFDPTTGDIKLFTPSRYPMNHWHYSLNTNGAPYRIENVEAAISRKGEWALNRDTGAFTISGDFGQLIAPRFEHIVQITEGAKYIRFEGISFRHNVYPMGVYDRHGKDWPDRLRKLDPSFPETFPPGMTDAQAAPNAGAAVMVENASHIAFVGCEFTQIGNYALQLKQNAKHCSIQRCSFHDLGAGALNICPDSSGLPDDQFPSHNLMEDCTIKSGGLVHVATVAIRIAHSHENIIQHNEISDFPYSGISVGWNWSRSPNRCYGNRIAHNDVHHITHTISDGSALYSLGILGGTVFYGNYMHDILRSENTGVGAANTGMLIDQYSLGIHFDQNIIRRVKSWRTSAKRHNEVYRHYRNEPGEHTWGDNDFADDDSPIRLKAIAEMAGPRG